MPMLLHFQVGDSHINIPKEVGTHYRGFGTHLLQDSTGSQISALIDKERHDAEKINTAILERWFSGEGLVPKTWDTLIVVLNRSDLGELAKKIEQGLHGKS